MTRIERNLMVHVLRDVSVEGLAHVFAPLRFQDTAPT